MSTAQISSKDIVVLDVEQKQSDGDGDATKS